MNLKRQQKLKVDAQLMMPHQKHSLGWVTKIEYIIIIFLLLPIFYNF